MFRIGVSSCRNVGVIFLECCWNVMQACIGELTNAYVVYFFVEKVFLFWYVQYTRKGGGLFLSVNPLRSLYWYWFGT